jgi:hypothetical protein
MVTLRCTDRSSCTLKRAPDARPSRTANNMTRTNTKKTSQSIAQMKKTIRDAMHELRDKASSKNKDIAERTRVRTIRWGLWAIGRYL